MKNLFSVILNGLTYPDLGGRRRPRVFALLALGILGLLVLTGGLGIFQRWQVMQPVEAEPAPVSVTLEVKIPKALVTKEPLACPTDPSEWDLANATITSNYKLIQPACVYAGLERSVAWVLAVRSGHTRQDATRILGFDRMPVTPLERVTLPTGIDETKEMAVTFAPTHPDLAEWRVDANGRLAIAYGLRGCFRTSSVSGNRIETWGGDYPVICIVVEDAENTRTVYAIGGHIYATEAIPTRSYLLFGYAGDGVWDWLGAQQAPTITIPDPAKAARDREITAALYESPLWEADYLIAAHHLEKQRLPDGWQVADDPAEAQAILDLVNTQFQEQGQ